ncbi:MAG: hypothetical protein SGPRY_004745, partial [Prymnesium sp.]
QKLLEEESRGAGGEEARAGPSSADEPSEDEGSSTRLAFNAFDFLDRDSSGSESGISEQLEAPQHSDGAQLRAKAIETSLHEACSRPARGGRSTRKGRKGDRVDAEEEEEEMLRAAAAESAAALAAAAKQTGPSDEEADPWRLDPTHLEAHT